MCYSSSGGRALKNDIRNPYIKKDLIGSIVSDGLGV